MSYNSYHKGGTTSGMSRGRGFSSRGSSFRGRGGADGSTWGPPNSRGRGGYSGSTRGRFNWYKEHGSSSFDSRSRYPSGSGAERYSGRGRGGMEDSSYRRYGRPEGSTYSGTRDHSHHRSPESQRKRMRTDHGYVQASSSRRSHDGSYGGSDYGSRYNYSDEKGGYGDERGRYHEDRRSATGFRERSREEYPHRKSEQMDSSMPPPSSAPPRHLASPRSSFRGRLSSRGTRGISRLMLARRTDILLAKRRNILDSYSVRKRILTARPTNADTLKRLKIQKLRRLKEAGLYPRGDRPKDPTKSTEDISDEEEKEETWDEELEKEVEEEEEEEEEEELEEGETTDKKEKVKRVKKATASEKEEPEEGEEIDEEEEEENETEAAQPAPVSKTPEMKVEGVHVTIKHDSEVRSVSEETRKPRTTFHGRTFIRLSCPRCFTRCITFKQYARHLYTSKHMSSMHKQSLRHKQTLARMRMVQRQKQRIVEEAEEARGALPSRTIFCPICKLNYRQLKGKHQLSDTHRAMKKFLMPYCRVCRIKFKSPMQYENHICSLDHIKKKAYMEERMLQEDREHRELGDEDDDDEDVSGIDEDDKDLSMDNFMTLDSVGTVDDTGDELDANGDVKIKGDKELKDIDDKKNDSELFLGAECVKLVEVYFCELCQGYLPRLDSKDRSLTIHCRTRTHLQRYLHYRDDRALRREAERRKELAKEAAAAKEADTKANPEEKKADEKKDEEGASGLHKELAGGEEGGKKANGDEPGPESSQKESSKSDVPMEGGEAQEGDGDPDQDLESGMDDKLWADVDKDLGELLREVEPGNKSSDEDEDSRAEGGRYDRFRYSEKGSSVVGEAPSEGDPQTPAKSEAEEPAAEPEVAEGDKEPVSTESPAPTEEAVVSKKVVGTVPSPPAAQQGTT